MKKLAFNPPIDKLKVGVFLQNTDGGYPKGLTVEVLEAPKLGARRVKVRVVTGNTDVAKGTELEMVIAYLALVEVDEA